jgi:tetratricopeptide (TPR) repeat protein
VRSFLYSALAVVAILYSGCGTGGGDEGLREQADVLFTAGRYAQALSLYEDLAATAEHYQWQLQYRLAETAVLASQAERNRNYRQRARTALDTLSMNPGECELSAIGHLWRRLGWEMVRDNDSLQAYDAFGMAIEIAPDLNQVFEEEWLLRGKYASVHLASVAHIPDSLTGTTAEDSILRYAAELHIVELDRIPLVRTDLRGDMLFARARLLQYTTGREEDELDVLTELDRMGLLNSSNRQRRMDILLQLAEQDAFQGDSGIARERLLEVWNSSFTGARVQAALQLGIMAEGAGNNTDALMWYNRACQISPGLSSAASMDAAARRDSLRYIGTP